MQEELEKEQENNAEVNNPEGDPEKEKHTENAVNPESHDAEAGKKHKKPVKKEDQTKDLQAKIDELNDKYLRLYSEFDNYRKRTFREKGRTH